MKSGVVKNEMTAAAPPKAWFNVYVSAPNKKNKNATFKSRRVKAMSKSLLVLLVLPALASAQDFWATDAGYPWFVHLPAESEQINPPFP